MKMVLEEILISEVSETSLIMLYFEDGSYYEIKCTEKIASALQRIEDALKKERE